MAGREITTCNAFRPSANLRWLSQHQSSSPSRMQLQQHATTSAWADCFRWTVRQQQNAFVWLALMTSLSRLSLLWYCLVFEERMRMSLSPVGDRKVIRPQNLWTNYPLMECSLLPSSTPFLLPPVCVGCMEKELFKIHIWFIRLVCHTTRRYTNLRYTVYRLSILAQLLGPIVIFYS